MKRICLLVALVALWVSHAPARAAPEAQAALGWKAQINGLVEGKKIGISVREADRFLYRHADTKRRTPASNEKLLLSMALLDRVGPDLRIHTIARAGNVTPEGVVPGNLWLLGRGDPHVGPGKLGLLAARIEEAGVTRVKGSVRGAISYFAHDWWAPGWKPYFPAEEIALPSALTFRGNVAGGKHISDPERRAARELTQQLRARGVKVAGKAGAGQPPGGLEEVGEVSSPPLIVLLRNMLRPSRNFYGEVLGKRLGVERQGPPGTISKGAAAIRNWAAGLGVRLVTYDCSGLSYRNGVSPRGMVRLLGKVEGLDWGPELMEALPSPGQGTLDDRLAGVPVKAKTGTLTRISALSGWVYLQETGTWAEFSIMSRGMATTAAKHLEDRIVRLIWKHAH